MTNAEQFRGLKRFDKVDATREQEPRRVLAPGGRTVLIDQDWDVAVLDADDLVTGREIHRAFCDSLVQGIGRQTGWGSRSGPARRRC